jgi:TPP-dependent trihydroxycyclohexane-1,2-dione (THcHDO) dehydratase
VHLHHVEASSGTCGCTSYGFSCYSWCLSTSRQPRVAEEHWHELVIVSGHLLMIVRGLVTSLVESQKVTLVDCSYHRVTSLMGRFLRCPSVGLGV